MYTLYCIFFLLVEIKYINQSISLPRHLACQMPREQEFRACSFTSLSPYPGVTSDQGSPDGVYVVVYCFAYSSCLLVSHWPSWLPPFK